MAHAGRDLDQFVFATKLMAFIQEIKVQNLTIPKLFAKTCEKYPNKVKNINMY